MSSPTSVFPTCFSMMLFDAKVESASYLITADRKFLYLRGGHANSEDYAVFGEIGSREAITSSMHTRFYVVPSKEHGDEQLVHIKSSYNKKYLVAKNVKGNVEPVMGTADEPEEELSKPSCTLFKVEEISKRDGRQQVRFMQPFLKQAACFVSNHVDPKTGKQVTDLHLDVDLVDVTDQIILPPYVSFKGRNGLYLRAVEFDEVFESHQSNILGSSVNYKLLEFSSKDNADKATTFTTLNYADGQVCIVSEFNTWFLVYENDWIRTAGVEDKYWDTAKYFRALKFGDSFVLQSMWNKQFCVPGKKEKQNREFLTPASEYITDSAKLILEEPVISREIYNIEYHRNDQARIYDTTDMNMATASAINRTSEKNTVKATVSFTTTESSKYDSTTTHKGNVSVSVSGGFKLFSVIDMNIQVQGGYEYSEAKTWGNASETEKKHEIEYEVTIPPSKKVTLTVTSKQAKYDVPFSYTQKDKLLNGEVRIYNHDDGLYSGMNCFDLRYETREEEIEPKKEAIELKKEVIEPKKEEDELSKKRKAMTE